MVDTYYPWVGVLWQGGGNSTVPYAFCGNNPVNRVDPDGLSDNVWNSEANGGAGGYVWTSFRGIDLNGNRITKSSFNSPNHDYYALNKDGKPTKNGKEISWVEYFNDFVIGKVNAQETRVIAQIKRAEIMSHDKGRLKVLTGGIVCDPNGIIDVYWILNPDGSSEVIYGVGLIPNLDGVTSGGVATQYDEKRYPARADL